MRRSLAPSELKIRNGKRKSEPNKSSPDKKKTCRVGDLNAGGAVDTTKRLRGDKLAFNVVWREQTTKKNKTWLGNGIIEIRLDNNVTKAVLLDDAGKYLGSTHKFNLTDINEGFQMRVGNKEIEIQEQIVDQNEYWQVRKAQVENRGWGTEEWRPPEENAKPTNKAMAKMSLPKINLNLSVPAQPKSSKENATAEDIGNTNKFKISAYLANLLRPHQREGVVFLYECLMGLRQQKNQQEEHFGCILADEMGLGKTLQVLTVANSLIRYCTQALVQRVLIVAPRSLVNNWNNEINKWLHTERMYGFVVDGSSAAKNRYKLSAYAKQTHVPFVIVSYESLNIQLEDFIALNFDLLICDEAHRIKNPDTKTYQALRALNIKRCVLLTGTPVQNVLGEFFALADFANPGILGSRQEFRQHFELTIELGQAPEASEEVKNLTDQRKAELNALTSSFLLRRLQNVNQKHLPSKREYICFVCPSKLQHMLLRKVCTYYEQKKESADSQQLNPLQLIGLLRKICNHPCLLRTAKQKDGHLSRSLARHVRDLQQLDVKNSSKLLLVQHLLLQAVEVNSEKVVLVSYHTKTLDVLQKLCDILSIKYLRLDGTTTASERSQIVLKFNAPIEGIDSEAYVLLLSAKAGGMGLNLIGASRLILYDIDWNPACDAQALSRIWREGQCRDVHIYRLITAGCIEEQIFKRQISKTNLGDFLKEKVENNVQQNATTTSMKFSAEEIKEIFQLKYDFNLCDTHTNLNCVCNGDGQNLSFDSSTTNANLQFNELSAWRHWQPTNADEAFLKAACLWTVKDELVYIFSNDSINNEPNI